MSDNATDWEELNRIQLGPLTDVYRVRTAANLICAVSYVSLPVQQGQQDGGAAASVNLDQLYANVSQLTGLRHDNLIRVLEARRLPQAARVAMFLELIEGHSLERVIVERHQSTGGGLTEDEIKVYLKQVCSALAYLHSKDIVFRFLDSDNVLVLEGSSKVKLIDYGVSVQLLEGVSVNVTGCRRGRPHYMAPELLDGENAVYSRGSDIWALGCLLYEMVVGVRPHADRKHMTAICASITEAGAPDLPESCSRHLKDFYACCTHMNQRRERATAESLLRHPFLTGGTR